MTKTRKAIRHTFGDKIFLTIDFIILFLLLIAIAYPLIYIFFASFNAQVTKMGLSLIPEKWSIQGYKAEPAWESTSTEALKNAAQRGIGIAFLPEKLVWCELQEGTLAQVQVVNLEIRRVIHMIYHRNKFISEAMGQWIEMIRESQWI